MLLCRFAVEDFKKTVIEVKGELQLAAELRRRSLNIEEVKPKRTPARIGFVPCAQCLLQSTYLFANSVVVPLCPAKFDFEGSGTRLVQDTRCSKRPVLVYFVYWKSWLSDSAQQIASLRCGLHFLA